MISAWDCPFKHIYFLNGNLVDVNTIIFQIIIIKKNIIKKIEKLSYLLL